MKITPRKYDLFYEVAPDRPTLVDDDAPVPQSLVAFMFPILPGGTRHVAAPTAHAVPHVLFLLDHVLALRAAASVSGAILHCCPRTALCPRNVSWWRWLQCIAATIWWRLGAPWMLHHGCCTMDVAGDAR